MIYWLRFLAITFAILFGLFLFIPDTFLSYLNDLGLVFFHFTSPRAAPFPPNLWQCLSLVLMLLMFFISFRAQSDWLRFTNFVPLILLEKAICAVAFLVLILLQPIHFSYIVGLVVDGLLFLLTAYAYAKAIQSRPQITPHTH